MFTANNSCSSYIEVILSMLPLYKVTPAISGLGVGWKTEKMVTGEEPLVIVTAVVTAVNGTLFPSSLRNRRRSILVGIIIEKYGEKKAGQNGRKSKDGCRFSVKHTRYEMRLNVSLDMMFARLLFQDGAGNCKKAYLMKANQNSDIMSSFCLEKSQTFTCRSSFLFLFIK